MNDKYKEEMIDGYWQITFNFDDMTVDVEKDNQNISDKDDK